MAEKKKREKEKGKLKLVFKQTEGISEEERQRRVHRAYDILFNEVAKRKNSE